MQNRCGTTAEMIFHNQNKISCLQEKGAYQYNTPSIWRYFRNHNRRVKNVFIHQHCCGSSFRKQNLNSAVKGHNCKHRVITLFQSFSMGEKKWPLQGF